LTRWYWTELRVRPYGKTNLVTVFLLLAVAAGIWLGALFSQPYLDNLNVKDAVAAAYADVNLGRTDDQIRNRILEEVNSPKVGTHQERDRFGELVTAPGLGLTAENITIERNDVNRTVRIRVDYDRDVRLKPLQKVIRVHFNPEKKGPATQ
jgi:hypothetical protein